MTIVEIQARPDGGHGLQSQSGRETCWLDGWIAVPQELEETAWDCKGYCTLDVQNDVLAGITPCDIPEVDHPSDNIEETKSPEELLKEIETLRSEIDRLYSAINQSISEKT